MEERHSRVCIFVLLPYSGDRVDENAQLQNIETH